MNNFSRNSDSEKINLDNLSTSEIENLRIERIKKLKETRIHKQQIKDSILQKLKERIGIEGELAELRIALSKASFSEKQIQSDIDILTMKFWSVKRNTEA